MNTQTRIRFSVAAILLLVSFISSPMSLEAEARAADEPPLCRYITDADSESILWLARVMYSETKNPNEMKLIGWVVRNRVETGYFGHTYKEVATSPHQFSGLNLGDPQYATNIGLDYGNTHGSAWKAALSLAREIYFASNSARPIPRSVKHFYTPSTKTSAPAWTKNSTLALQVFEKNSSKVRFAFYETGK